MYWFAIMLLKIKRLYVQFFSTIFFNLPFLSIYLKNTAVPVLNCYACPLAAGACPIGAIQNFITTGQFPFFLIGLLGFFGLMLGRYFCGYMCPFGFIQDLLSKISKKNIKLSFKTSYIKFYVLIIFVVILPFIFKEPIFCKICPAGTLEAGIPIVASEYYKENFKKKAEKAKNKIVFKKSKINMINPDLMNVSTILSMVGYFFFLKVLLLVFFMILSIFIKRPFCRVCPLGAIYAVFNKINFFNNNVIDNKSCTSCNLCSDKCPSGINPVEEIDSIECIKCNECRDINCGSIKRK